MSCLLIAAMVTAVVWALIQGLVPLLIDVFVSRPENYGDELARKVRYKRTFTWVSIGILGVIAILTVLGLTVG